MADQQYTEADVELVDSIIDEWVHRSQIKAGPAGEIADMKVTQNVAMDRAPAQCKTCASPCICPCHERPADA